LKATGRRRGGVLPASRDRDAAVKRATLAIEVDNNRIGR
jgi:hypothetical protein